MPSICPTHCSVFSVLHGRLGGNSGPPNQGKSGRRRFAGFYVTQFGRHLMAPYPLSQQTPARRSRFQLVCNNYCNAHRKAIAVYAGLSLHFTVLLACAWTLGSPQTPQTTLQAHRSPRKTKWSRPLSGSGQVSLEDLEKQHINKHRDDQQKHGFCNCNMGVYMKEKETPEPSDRPMGFCCISLSP